LTFEWITLTTKLKNHSNAYVMWFVVYFIVA